MDSSSGRTAVVRIDGGICSQINFVAHGRALARALGDGATVKYDLSWFRENGRDINGRFVRNWDFPLAFPGLRVEEATADEIAAARRRRVIDFAELRSPADADAPAYFCGYPGLCFALPGCREELSENFRPALDERSAAVAEEIAKGPACAVHVRRGDLSEYSVAYGRPCTAGYFSRAARIVRGLEPDARFFFFSDEPDYVRDELLPALPPGLDCTVVSGNGSDRGYADLALISKCGYVVSSIGSLGVYGAFLGRAVLVSPKMRPDCFRALEEVIYLNEDRQETYGTENRERRRRVLPGVVKVMRGRSRSLVLLDRVTIDYRR